MAGCSKDDPSDPDNLVADPQGTITANISDGSSSQIEIIEGGSMLAVIRWTSPDNFYLDGYLGGSYGYYDDEIQRHRYYQVSICNLGAMSGLGNITKIPTSGFTIPSSGNSSVACESGHGYVVKVEKHDGSNLIYVRLYVVEPIVSTTGGIMGAKVKYQYPFKP
jgi:hypothetical protein